MSFIGFDAVIATHSNELEPITKGLFSTDWELVQIYDPIARFDGKEHVIFFFREHQIGKESAQR